MGFNSGFKGLRTFYLMILFSFISQLELLCILTASIERSAIGNTLKDHIISLGIVRQALEYITVSRLLLENVNHSQSPVIYMKSYLIFEFSMFFVCVVVASCSKPFL